eukprot:scaffold907_cov318-Pavlova_lutheri.AAC.2
MDEDGTIGYEYPPFSKGPIPPFLRLGGRGRGERLETTQEGPRQTVAGDVPDHVADGRNPRPRQVGDSDECIASECLGYGLEQRSRFEHRPVCIAITRPLSGSARAGRPVRGAFRCTRTKDRVSANPLRLAGIRTGVHAQY